MSSESSPQVGEGWDRSLPESQMTCQLSSQTLPEFSLSPQLIIVAYLLDSATGQYWTCLCCPGTNNDLVHLYRPFIFQEHLDLWAHFSLPVAENWWATSFLEKLDTARLSISTLPLQMWLAHLPIINWERQWTDRCYVPPVCSFCFMSHPDSHQVGPCASLKPIFPYSLYPLRSCRVQDASLMI